MKLQSVGIKNFTCPISVREKSNHRQHTVATINLQVSMPHQYRESCVAVFNSVLGKYKDDMHVNIFPKLLTSVRDRLKAAQAQLSMSFPYFIAKKAPITKTVSLMEYQCSFTCSINDSKKLLLAVHVPITTLCPCSKEISDKGAHNQRAEVTLTVTQKKFIWLEDLISLVEKCGSCELYALLKRPDEKFVTEQAYANPLFVEDVVRIVALKAMEHPAIGWFSVGVESFESIHKHSAYAFVDADDL